MNAFRGPLWGHPTNLRYLATIQARRSAGPARIAGQRQALAAAFPGAAVLYLRRAG